MEAIKWEKQDGVLEGDMLAAAYALRKFPLYNYANTQNQMRLTFFCLAEHPDRAYALMRIALWCGQMQNYSLHLRIVSDDAERIRAQLLHEVPILAGYTNLDASNPGEYLLADFEFVTDSRVELASKSYKRRNKKAEEAGIALGSEYDGQWCAVLMGERSASFAARYYLGLTQQPKSLLLLDGQPQALSKETAESIKTMRTLFFIGERTRAIDTFRDELLIQARRTHLVYMGNGHTRNNVSAFHKDKYSHESSAAFALHIPYKLMDIGINPKLKNSLIAQKYAEMALPDKTSANYNAQVRTFCELAGLEHRRWLMYLVVSGWRPASISDCRELCFKENTILRKSCYKFKIDERRLHPALVPGTGEKGLAEWTKAQWDELRTEAQINALELDPLDKVSLRLHLLAGEIMRGNAPQRQGHLDSLKKLADGNKEVLRCFSMFSNWYLSEGCNEHSRYAEQKWFELIEAQYKENGIEDLEVRNVLERLRTELKIVNEFYSYNDYKNTDNAVIEQMAYIYLKPKQLVMISLMAEGMLDNLTPLMVSPDKVAMFGLGEEEGRRLQTLLQEYADIEECSFEEVKKGESPAQVYKQLKHTVDKEMKNLDKSGLCVLDITGASEVMITAAVKLRGEEEYKKLGLLVCDSVSQRVTDLGGFYCAPICRPHVSITVKEMMELYGASAVSYDTSELTRWKLLVMKDDFQKIWDFAQSGIDYKHFYEIMNTNLAFGFSICSWHNQNVSFELLKSQCIPSGISDVLDRMKEDGQLSSVKIVEDSNTHNYKITLHVPDEILALTNQMFEFVQGGGVGELIYQSNKEYCCVSVRGDKKRPLVQWQMNENRQESKREFTFDAKRIVDLKLPTLFSVMKKEKVISEQTVSGPKINLKGPACVLDAIGSLLNMLRFIQKANLVLDAKKCTIYNEETSLFEREESPCPELVPEGCFYLVGWKHISIKETEKTWKLPTGLIRRTQLKCVLADIADSTSNKTPFTWELKESIIDPETAQLCCKGPKRIVDALEGLIFRIQNESIENLFYNKQKHSIAPQNSGRFTAKLSKSKKEHQNALKKASEGGVIENLKIISESEAVFELRDRAFAEIFESEGKLLEFYTWHAAYTAGFDDVQNGYRFLWGEKNKEGMPATENELDVLCISGLRLMLISCKDTRIVTDNKTDECKFNMYEIRTLANQFSKKTKAVLLYHTTDTLSPNLENRAESIGTKVLVLDSKKNECLLSDGSTLTETLKRLMD